MIGDRRLSGLGKSGMPFRLPTGDYARSDGPPGLQTTAAQRIAAHGWQVVPVAGGAVVPMNQPERGLIPLLLDAQAAEELVAGERLLPTLTGVHIGPLVVSSGVACLVGDVELSDRVQKCLKGDRVSLRRR